MKKLATLIVTGLVTLSAVGFSYTSANAVETSADLDTTICASNKLEDKLEAVAAMVADGDLTQEEADVLIAAFENCEGASMQIMRTHLNRGQQDGQGRQANRGQMRRLGNNR